MKALLSTVDFLKGKKTYVFASIIILKALYGFLNDDMSGSELLDYIIAGGATASIRAGISKK